MKKATIDKPVLEAKIRELTGKKAKKLRKEGLVLANIYGPEFKSQSVSVNFKDFLKTYKIAKETSVVFIKLNKEEIPVLIKSVQKHPVTDFILHVDFRKIDLKKKIETEVPVKVIGISEAVSQKGGVLLIQTDNVLIEALPQDIPSNIEVDITVLKEIGQEIKISDLKKSALFEIKTPLEKVLVSVVEHKEESVTPDTTAAAPEVLTEAPAAEGEEGAEAQPTEAAEKGKPETKTEPKGKPAPPSKPESAPPQK